MPVRFIVINACKYVINDNLHYYEQSYRKYNKPCGYICNNFSGLRLYNMAAFEFSP